MRDIRLRTEQLMKRRLWTHNSALACFVTSRSTGMLQLQPLSENKDVPPHGIQMMFHDGW